MQPELVGTHGSGTIFLTNCNLLCVYCQNYEISHQGEGEVKDEALRVNERGIAYRGSLVRHLVLPDNLAVLRSRRRKAVPQRVR